MTTVISGRPARCLANRFTALGQDTAAEMVPPIPIAHDAGKLLNAAAKGVGEAGFGAQWAGQGASLARAMPAGPWSRNLNRRWSKHSSVEAINTSLKRKRRSALRLRFRLVSKCLDSAQPDQAPGIATRSGGEYGSDDDGKVECVLS